MHDLSLICCTSKVISPLGHYFFISWFTDFLAAKTGRSVGKKKNFFFQKALLCQVVEKSYRYMDIVIKSDVLRKY